MPAVLPARISTSPHRPIKPSDDGKGVATEPPSGLVFVIVVENPKMWILGVLFGLSELFQGLAVPPCGQQSPRQRRSSSHCTDFEPAGLLHLCYVVTG